MQGNVKRRISTVLAASAVGVLITTGTAHADARVEVLDGSGWARWTESGDTLKVCDSLGDGWGVRAYIYRPNAGDPANGTVLLKVNDGKYDSDCASASADIPENITINIKVCNYRGSSVGLCDWARARTA